MPIPVERNSIPETPQEFLQRFRDEMALAGNCPDCLKSLNMPDMVCPKCGYDSFYDDLEYVDDEPI